jgi:6-phosphogluconate dehydrogenase
MELGMIGLGVMGRNLLLNMADHGFPVAGYDQDPAKVEALLREGKGLDLAGADDLQGLLAGLRAPRAVMLLVPAGAPVDAVLGELAPRLGPGDLIIDSGNSHFKDTDRRGAELAARGLLFMGMGISGGENGARRGPSMMPGGPPEAYQRVRPLLEAVAAQAGGSPCVAHVGPGSAGHYVKMVHNGIEYALMELIAESYDLMKRGLGMDNAGIRRSFQEWSEGGLGGYLMEITAAIFARRDTLAGQDLIDAVLGVARQNGTGIWTSQSAMELQVPAPTIDQAVAQRDLSALDRERERAGHALPRTTGLRRYDGDRSVFLVSLGQALHAGMVMAFAQGMALLGAASERYGYQVDHHPRGAAGGHRGGLRPGSRAGEPAAGSGPGADGAVPGGIPARRGLRGGPHRHPHPRADERPGLPGQLPQPLAPGQPHPGPAGLLRGAHL